jgi:hypothetical protein
MAGVYLCQILSVTGNHLNLISDQVRVTGMALISVVLIVGANLQVWRSIISFTLRLHYLKTRTAVTVGQEAVRTAVPGFTWFREEEYCSCWKRTPVFQLIFNTD